MRRIDHATSCVRRIALAPLHSNDDKHHSQIKEAEQWENTIVL